MVDVCSLNINVCLACEYCHIKGNTGGVPKDDVQWIYNLLKETQMLVIASSIYYHGITGQLKCVLDHFYSASCPSKPPKLKKIARILSSDDPDMYVGELFLLKEDFLDYLGLEDMGVFTSHDEENRSKQKEKELYDFGISLV